MWTSVQNIGYAVILSENSKMANLMPYWISKHGLPVISIHNTIVYNLSKI